MDTAQLASLIVAVGAALPLLTSLVEQPTWSTRTRTVVGVIMSILAGLVTYVTQYGLDFSNVAALVTTIVGIALASGAAYKTIWQPSGIAPALEGKTSPTPPPPPAVAAPDVIVVDAPDEEFVEMDRFEPDPLDTPEDIPDEPEPPEGFDDGSRPVVV